MRRGGVLGGVVYPGDPADRLYCSLGGRGPLPQGREEGVFRSESPLLPEAQNVRNGAVGAGPGDRGCSLCLAGPPSSLRGSAWPPSCPGGDRLVRRGRLLFLGLASASMCRLLRSGRASRGPPGRPVREALGGTLAAAPARIPLPASPPRCLSGPLSCSPAWIVRAGPSIGVPLRCGPFSRY